MLNHQEHVHKHWVTDYNAKATKASMNLKLAVDEGTGVVDLETQIRWTKERHHNACRKLAFWLAKRKRPLSIVEHEEFRDFTSAISMGKFSSTSRREMDKQMSEMGGAVLHNHREAVAQMKKTGVKPSMAADIWSDTDVSLLAMTLYFKCTTSHVLEKTKHICIGTAGWNATTGISMQNRPRCCPRTRTL